MRSVFITRYSALLSVVSALLSVSCSEKDRFQMETFETAVLVIGGGASGIAAAIQSARLDTEVILVEETPWLGGMLTAAGVSATDGNHHLPSGIWGEFREKIYTHYGGQEAVATGWVSNTQFEPHIGNRILNELADQEKKLKRIHGYWVIQVLKERNVVTGAVFQNSEERRLKITAKVVIDATELGDVIALSGADYLSGQDPKSLTGERFAPEKPNDIIQDLTYAVILKDYGIGADKTIPKLDSFDPSVFDCTCKELCSRPGESVVSCDKMLEYGRLPNDKYMINWPDHGNDFYVNVLEMTREERSIAYQKAKEHSLNYIYFLQTAGGYKHLGLAEDEFSTADHLPFIPYHRESRRLKGLDFLTVTDLEDPYRDASRPYYQAAIAVGDYPIDHHHEQNKNSPKEFFPAIPSFSVPYGCLVPQKIDGLLAAEKSISVSHMANGSTRLQPCVMLIGQAAGVAASLCAERNIQPRAIPIRELQAMLLEAGCWLLPFMDTQPADWYFKPLQKMGVCGVFRGQGVPYQWANQTWIYPDSAVMKSALVKIMELLSGAQSAMPVPGSDSPISRAKAIKDLWLSLGKPENTAGSMASSDQEDKQLMAALDYFKAQGWTTAWLNDSTDMLEQPLLRKELAYLIDKIYDPFNQLPLKAGAFPKN